MTPPRISEDRTRIGWIGTGVMGAPMAGHLIEAGYQLNVFNRTRSRAESLLKSGASWCSTPREVASASDVIFTIVGYPDDVRKVVLGDKGVLVGCRENAVIVDMTTSRPSLALEIADRARANKVVSIDAPVSGGDIGARNGTLSIMIGGEAETVESLEPIWNILGKTFVRQGSAGAGQHTKMVNQTLIATGMIGVCEALLYAFRAGLDLDTVLKSVGSGAAGSWSLSNLGPRIIDDDFDPGFYVRHFIKDMDIAIGEADRMGLSLPGLSLARQLYNAVAAQGYSEMGTHALQLALASLSGIDWKVRSSVNSELPMTKNTIEVKTDFDPVAVRARFSNPGSVDPPE